MRIFIFNILTRLWANSLGQNTSDNIALTKINSLFIFLTVSISSLSI